MNLEETKSQLKKLISEVNAENSDQFYEKIGAVVEAYRDSGGTAQPIQDYLLKLDKELGHLDPWKEEQIMDITNRLAGYAPPFRRIIFPGPPRLSEPVSSEIVLNAGASPVGEALARINPTN